ncbi:MAG TPA: hypothetical protein VMQ65_11060 [Candidatus Limnocylindria bacterium]|nr:hypothetical protein [Candidatus Limnocylindria bacterium]
MRTSNHRRGAVLALVPGMLLLAAAAEASPTRPEFEPGAGSAQTMVLTVGHTSAGDALAGPNGMTLYVRTTDVDGVSDCTTGTCATTWPALKGDASQVRRGTGVSGSFGTTTWSDGTLQITHNGQPLYYYSRDIAVGDARGQKPGGAWLIAPVGDASACQTLPIPAPTAESTFRAPAPANRASENSNGEY